MAAVATTRGGISAGPGDQAGVVQDPAVADEVGRDRGEERGQEEPAEYSTERLQSIRVPSVDDGGVSHSRPPLSPESRPIVRRSHAPVYLLGLIAPTAARSDYPRVRNPLTRAQTPTILRQC